MSLLLGLSAALLSYAADQSLVASLSADKTEYTANEPIHLTLVVSNNSSSSVRIAATPLGTISLKVLKNGKRVDARKAISSPPTSPQDMRMRDFRELQVGEDFTLTLVASPTSIGSRCIVLQTVKSKFKSTKPEEKVLMYPFVEPGEYQVTATYKFKDPLHRDVYRRRITTNSVAFTLR